MWPSAIRWTLNSPLTLCVHIFSYTIYSSLHSLVSDSPNPVSDHVMFLVKILPQIPIELRIKSELLPSPPAPGWSRLLLSVTLPPFPSYSVPAALSSCILHGCHLCSSCSWFLPFLRTQRDFPMPLTYNRC